MLDSELQEYILRYGHSLMTSTELQALKRILLTEHGEQSTRMLVLTNPFWEKIYGFDEQVTNELLPRHNPESLRRSIAERIWPLEDGNIYNWCPRCDKLARTPEAKQCRHCGHDWH